MDFKVFLSHAPPATLAVKAIGRQFALTFEV